MNDRTDSRFVFENADWLLGEESPKRMRRFEHRWFSKGMALVVVTLLFFGLAAKTARSSFRISRPSALLQSKIVDPLNGEPASLPTQGEASFDTACCLLRDGSNWTLQQDPFDCQGASSSRTSLFALLDTLATTAALENDERIGNRSECAIDAGRYQSKPFRFDLQSNYFPLGSDVAWCSMTVGPSTYAVWNH